MLTQEMLTKLQGTWDIIELKYILNKYAPQTAQNDSLALNFANNIAECYINGEWTDIEIGNIVEAFLNIAEIAQN